MSAAHRNGERLVLAYRTASAGLRKLGTAEGSRADNARAHHRISMGSVVAQLQHLDPALADALAAEHAAFEDVRHAEHFSPPEQAKHARAALATVRADVRRRLDFLTTMPDPESR